MSIYGHIDGRLTRNAELKSVGDNQVLKFSVATDRFEKKQKIAQYLECDFWGSRAASIVNYMQKGQQVAIRGELFNREYQAKDVTMKTSMHCRVDDVKLMGGKKESEGKSDEPAPYGTETSSAGGGHFDDGIPFSRLDNFQH